MAAAKVKTHTKAKVKAKAEAKLKAKIHAPLSRSAATQSRRRSLPTATACILAAALLLTHSLPALAAAAAASSAASATAAMGTPRRLFGGTTTRALSDTIKSSAFHIDPSICPMSLKDSMGYICDPDFSWRMRKAVAWDQQVNRQAPLLYVSFCGLACSAVPRMRLTLAALRTFPVSLCTPHACPGLLSSPCSAPQLQPPGPDKPGCMPTQ